MRLLALTPLLLLAPMAHAQSVEDGCTEAEPCPWTFDVDADGFSADGPFQFTEGDWIYLDVLNFDSVDHTLRLGDLTWEVPADFAEAPTTPFQLAAGSYTLVDEPSGDRVDVEVTPDATTETDTQEEAPGWGLAPALAVLCLAALRRR